MFIKLKYFSSYASSVKLIQFFYVMGDDLDVEDDEYITPSRYVTPLFIFSIVLRDTPVAADVLLTTSVNVLQNHHYRKNLMTFTMMFLLWLEYSFAEKRYGTVLLS